MSVIYFKNQYYPKTKEGIHFPHEYSVAFEGLNTFFATGLLMGSGITHYSENSQIDIKNWITENFGATDFKESTYLPGTIYKRMWRPVINDNIRNIPEAISNEAFTQASVSLKILLNKLEELFLTIEPDSANLSVYGHKIREILLLACMEVESSWSAVLRENNYSRKEEKYWNREDYVKLHDPMLLEAYKLKLRFYSSFPSFNPFLNWNNKEMKNPLPWYDAYNKSKHQREKYLNQATFENAINAVGAAVVMFQAQFGPQLPRHWMEVNNINDAINSVFTVDMSEIEKHREKFYIADMVVQPPNSSPMAISSRKWNLIDYSF